VFSSSVGIAVFPSGRHANWANNGCCLVPAVSFPRPAQCTSTYVRLASIIRLIQTKTERLLTRGGLRLSQCGAESLCSRYCRMDSAGLPWPRAGRPAEPVWTSYFRVRVITPIYCCIMHEFCAASRTGSFRAVISYGDRTSQDWTSLAYVRAATVEKLRADVRRTKLSITRALGAAKLTDAFQDSYCSSAATSRRHCFSHRTLHRSVQLCDRL